MFFKKEKFYRGLHLPMAVFLFLVVANQSQVFGRQPISRTLPDPYYPQQPEGGLRLNYYYDRSGRWVKFSDWIPYQQKKYSPRFLEDYYELFGLSHSYRVAEIKESIFFLGMGLESPFRHPRNSLTKIETEEQYHKYRLLMFMHMNLLIMRMHLRLGSLYDKRHLYFHDLDFADDLEVSFLIARTYYREADRFREQAEKYAKLASRYAFTIDLPTIETERFEMVTGKRNWKRIIAVHNAKVNEKLKAVAAFLDEHGRPRPVKTAMQKNLEPMYDESFTPEPLEMPRLDPEWKTTPLFPEYSSFDPTEKEGQVREPEENGG